MAKVISYPELMKQPRFFFAHMYGIEYGKENKIGASSTIEMIGLLSDSEIVTAIAQELYKPRQPNLNIESKQIYNATQIELF